jgi:hypothetical protein
MVCVAIRDKKMLTDTFQISKTTIDIPSAYRVPISVCK